MDKKPSELICWFCIHNIWHDEKIEFKSEPNRCLFPVLCYCSKGNTESYINCSDFETTKELARKEIEIIENSSFSTFSKYK